MSRILLFGLLIVSCVFGAFSQSTSIRVLCYNIHHCNPPSKKDLIDISAISKVIKENKPDLVALQEVDVYTERSGKEIHEAEELAKLNGMHYYFHKNIDYQGGAYGIAILSKYPLVDTAGYSLSMNTGIKGEPRGLVTVTVKVPNVGKVMLACTHLDLKEENRILQINSINCILEKVKFPVIIAGDFNALSTSSVIKVLDEQFQRTCTDCPPTIPEINPNRAIDFIAFKPKNAFQVIEHKVIKEPYASDHLPVSAVLEIKSNN